MSVHNKIEYTQVNGYQRRKAIPSFNSQSIGGGKLQPQATDLEEIVLGALMLEKDAILDVIDKLKPEIFYQNNHQIICSAILSLFHKSNPIDIRTVTAELRKLGNLEMVGGAYYITELTSSVASAANIVYHISIIVEKFMQREIISISSQTITSAYEDTSDVFELIDRTSSAVADLLSDTHASQISDAANLVGQRKMELYENPIDGLVGVPSGFITLDRITNGWCQPELCIIAARPAMGKTAFILNCARNASVEFKKPGLIFSLEMSSMQLVDRLISKDAEINLDKIIKRSLDEHDIVRLDNSTIELMIQGQLFIDDTPGISIFELRAKAKRFKQKHNIEYIMVDYIQLMKGTTNGGGNREQEVGSISRGLKALAKELHIPVIALSQLSRAVETRPGGSKRPQLSDLRESGSLEQDADRVIFLYRPEYYGLTEDEEGMPTNGIVEVIIAKNRFGVCDTVKLNANLSIMKFFEMESDQANFLPPINPPTNINITPYKNFGNKFSLEDDEAPF